MKQQTPKELQELFHSYLNGLAYARAPKGLYEPIEYVLDIGGKRIRPMLMLLAYNLFKEDVQSVLPQAAALETYHNCMMT